MFGLVEYNGIIEFYWLEYGNRPHRR